MTVEEMQKKVSDLTAQREQHIAQANFLAGQIQILMEFLAPPPVGPPVVTPIPEP